MKKLNKTASKYANILRFFTIIALGILGALMLILMFSQLFVIGRIMISNNLITAHGEPMQILIHAVAILLLIIGVVILNKHIKL